MLSKTQILSFLLITPILMACDAPEYQREFSLISVASFPQTIKDLKERWFFCEECLKNSKCEPDDIKQCRTITIPGRGEALSLAVTTANTEAVYFLVNETKTDVNETVGVYQETPLMIAAYYGKKKHQEIAEFLISHGADINAVKLSTHDTALLTAIWKNNTDFAKLLLKHGADPSISATGREEGRACKFAINDGRSAIIPYIPDCCSVVALHPVWIRKVGYLCP